MGGFVILLALYVVLYLPLTAYLYGRQRRWYGMLGWDLLVLGLLLAFGGAGDAFAWAGLLWAGLAATGVIMLLIDIAELRSRRRRGHYRGLSGRDTSRK